MIIKNIIDTFFPRLCFGCDTPLLRNQKILCTSCLHQLPFTRQHLYRDHEALDKFYGRLSVQSCSCLLYFTKEGLVQRLFHHLKYKNQSQISYYLGQMYAFQLQNIDWLTTVDSIIPVPLHKKKQKARGFNQVDGFAQALSEAFNIPIDNQLLMQKIHSVSQTQKKLFERTKPNPSRFTVNYKPHHRGQHFLIVDDILTTGGTLESCGKKLLEIPDSKISILCLAQTQ